MQIHKDFFPQISRVLFFLNHKKSSEGSPFDISERSWKHYCGRPIRYGGFYKKWHIQKILEYNKKIEILFSELEKANPAVFESVKSFK